jgi:hypothetical protein
MALTGRGRRVLFAFRALNWCVAQQEQLSKGCSTHVDVRTVIDGIAAEADKLISVLRERSGGAVRLPQLMV